MDGSLLVSVACTLPCHVALQLKSGSVCPLVYGQCCLLYCSSGSLAAVVMSIVCGPVLVHFCSYAVQADCVVHRLLVLVVLLYTCVQGISGLSLLLVVVP
jgi:hypothetical protein